MNTTEVAYSRVETLQAALSVITAAYCFDDCYLWPKQAKVCNGGTYDYIIVGAGSAGCVVASRLTEDPSISVLLVEAGDNPPLTAVYPGILLFEKGTRYDWNFTTEYSLTQKCHQNSVGSLLQGKMLGGTSSINFEYYQRGIPSDFNAWAKLLNDPTWSYDNVLPLFKKSEKLEDDEIAKSPDGAYHGYDGYLRVTKDPRKQYAQKFLGAFKELKNDIVLDLNGNQSLGYTNQLLAIGKNGIRSNSAISFLTPAKGRPNLHVLKNALVTKIICNKQKNAVAVKVQIGNKCIVLKANREIIISAGPVNSAKLLMLSGIGPRQHLKEKGIKVLKDLPVGKNLQDHVTVIVQIVLDFEKQPSCYPKRINAKLYTVPTVEGRVSLNKRKNCSDPDYSVVSYISNVYDQASLIRDFCVYEYRFNENVCRAIYEQTIGKQFFYGLITKLKPRSRGYVKLRSTNPKVAPIIQPAYFNNTKDLDDAVKYVKDYLKVLNTTYFKKQNAKFVDGSCVQCKGKRGDEYWECYVVCMMFGMSQLAGTCAMGTVVDSRLQVNGIGRLRVVDSGVMPTLTSGDVYVPTVMIAEKASIMIQEDLKRSIFQAEDVEYDETK